MAEVVRLKDLMQNQVNIIVRINVDSQICTSSIHNPPRPYSEKRANNKLTEPRQCFAAEYLSGKDTDA